MRYRRGIAQGEEVEQLLLNRDTMLTEIKFFLKHAQERMKIQYDKHHRELSFQVGDMVFVKFRPYRQHSVLSWSSHKLSPKFAGPFPVMKKIEKVAYEIDLPPEARIHTVIHVYMLKKALGRTESADTLLLNQVTEQGSY